MEQTKAFNLFKFQNISRIATRTPYPKVWKLTSAPSDRNGLKAAKEMHEWDDPKSCGFATCAGFPRNPSH